MKKEDLIGRKVKGFLFGRTSDGFVCINPMSDYEGKVGVIEEYVWRDSVRVRFEDGTAWIYPIDLVYDYLVGEDSTVDTNNFKKITDSIASILSYKNNKYGNSALSPINVFNGKSKVGQRADDKISRIQNSEKLQKNDVADLLGYLILICQENGWDNFDEFKD